MVSIPEFGLAIFYAVSMAFMLTKENENTVLIIDAQSSVTYRLFRIVKV